MSVRVICSCVYRGAQQTFEEFEALSLEDGEPNASEVLV